jgi:hypothetical protein
MIDYIKKDEQIIAIIIKSSFQKTGIDFFTPGDFSQQLGYMNRAQGYKIEPHVHKLVERKVTLTQEVLFVKSGKVKVDLYDNDKVFITTKVIEKGDVILLASGGHGFEMLENSELIEVKQGPYCGDEDKVRFSPLSNVQIEAK